MHDNNPKQFVGLWPTLSDNPVFLARDVINHSELLRHANKQLQQTDMTMFMAWRSRNGMCHNKDVTLRRPG